jgi:hypothetical protein
MQASGGFPKVPSAEGKESRGATMNTTREEHLEAIRKVLNLNILSTINLTRRRAITPSEPPKMEQLFSQIVANQVSMMQALAMVMDVLVEDFGAILRDE